MSNTVKGILFALLAATVYGLAPPFTRLAYVNGVPPLESTTWRTFALVVIFAVFVLWRGISLRIPKGASVPLFLMCLSTSIISIGYLGSVQFIPVALAVITFFTFPIQILLLSPIIEGRRLSWQRIAIGCLAFAGLVLAIGPEFSNVHPAGLALAVMGSFGATTQFFSGRVLARHMNPVAFGLIAHLVLLPIVAVIVLWSGDGQFVSLSATDTISLIGWLALAVVALTYALAFFSHMMSVRFAAPSTVAPFFNLEPVTSIMVAIIFLKEIPGQLQLIGGGLVLTALVAAGLTGTRQPQVNNTQ